MTPSGKEVMSAAGAMGGGPPLRQLGPAAGHGLPGVLGARSASGSVRGPGRAGSIARASAPPREASSGARAWLSAGAAAQAEFSGSPAGSGSGRRSPEGSVVNKARPARRRPIPAREGGGVRRDPGPRSGRTCPEARWASGRVGLGPGPRRAEEGSGSRKNFAPSYSPCRLSRVGPLGLLFFCVPGGFPLVLYLLFCSTPFLPFPSPFFPTSPFFPSIPFLFLSLPPPYLSLVSVACVSPLVDSGGWFPLYRDSWS